jgi:hypothetical protein
MRSLNLVLTALRFALVPCARWHALRPQSAPRRSASRCNDERQYSSGAEPTAPGRACYATPAGGVHVYEMYYAAVYRHDTVAGEMYI